MKINFIIHSTSILLSEEKPLLIHHPFQFLLELPKLFQATAFVSGCFGAAEHSASGRIDMWNVPIFSAISDISVLSRPIRGLKMGIDSRITCCKYVG